MKSSRPFRPTAAFTLIELLVVIAIMTLIMTMAIPATTSLLNSTNLSQGSQTLINQMDLARQIASSRNCTVQVCLIKLTNNSPNGFSAVQLRTNVAGTTSTVPASRITVLPQGIVIAQDTTTLSPLLAPLTISNLPAGTAEANAPYCAFNIMASGVVTPVLTMSNLYLTLVPSRFAANTTLPPNYSTIQINPNTGTPLLYRP